MLDLSHVKVTYGNLHALDDLSLHLDDGCLYGIVGPNGAGKTTAIKVITGLLVPEEGSVEIAGIDALKYPRRVKDVIGYVPDDFGVYDNLTAREYMEFFAEAGGLRGLKGRKRCMDLLGQVGLDDKADFHVDTLSRGMQQRLCLARALIHDPQFLVMDEPTSGLDPRTRFEFKEIIRDLHAQGKTLLISSHILSELAQMCTHIGIIENGKMLLDGRIEDIMARIESSNPLLTSILDGVADTMAILKRDLNVLSISVSGHTFLLNYDGGREDEASLLQQLIAAEIPVREFVREPGSLESYFMQITGHSEEKVILKNDY